MTKIGELAIHIVGDTGKLESATRRARKDVQTFSATVTGQAVPALGAMALKAGAAGAALLGLSSAAGFITSGVKLAAQAQATAKAFEVMVGSAEGGARLVGQLKEMANTTPFLTREVIAAGRSLAALARDGKDIEEIPDSLRRLGDIASALQLPLGELAILYGRAQSAGLLYTEDLNQFVDRGIALHKVLGMNLTEMKKMASQGRFTFDMLKEAIAGMTSEGGQFFNMTQIQSEQLIGRWSTINSKIDEMRKTLGELLLPVIEKVVGALESGLANIASAVQFLKDNWHELARVMNQSIQDGIDRMEQFVTLISFVPGAGVSAEAMRTALGQLPAGAAFDGMFNDLVPQDQAVAAAAAEASANAPPMKVELVDDPFANIKADPGLDIDARRVADERGAAFLRDKFNDMLRGLAGPQVTAITGRNSAIMAGSAEAVALQNQQNRMDVPQQQLRAQLDANRLLRDIAGGVGRFVAQPSVVLEAF